VVEAGPPGTRFAVVHRFEEVDSTNRVLLDEARAGAPDGTVAVAAFQRAGRGRLGRRWEAPPGSNLLMSVLLRPGLVPGELHLCTVAVALAAADACAAVAGLEPELKWPNDLMVGERKLAGILAEIVPAGVVAEPRPGAGADIGADAGTGRSGTAVVVGLGLNVQWPPSEHAPPSDDALPDDALPGDDLLDVATSLGRETGSTLDATVVLDAVLAGLEPRLVDLGSVEGRRRLAGDYRRRCATLGRTVRVTGHDESFTGVATDITVAGHLMVDVGTCLRTVTAGDVVHLRAQA